MVTPRIGVLALQGDVREHRLALEKCGAVTSAVRRPEELAALDGLVIPGGESSAIWNLARSFGMAEPLRAAIASGLPSFGTCAGMVLLADHVVDPAPGQEGFGGLDVTVQRNAFGRQVDSFEQDLAVAGVEEPVHALFIRAPVVTQVGPGVEVLARAAGRIVAVRQKHVLATSFHPEVGGGLRIHELFLSMVRAR